ncbi:hypothetical protein KDK82_5192 [Delftia sp. K82]|nr:hypothetical protein KDK82_5192 [Delftia sp. K82]
MGVPCVPPFRVNATVFVQVLIGLLLASTSCTRSTLVELPLATIDAGVATIVDALVLGVAAA